MTKRCIICNTVTTCYTTIQGREVVFCGDHLERFYNLIRHEGMPETLKAIEDWKAAPQDKPYKFKHDPKKALNDCFIHEHSDDIYGPTKYKRGGMSDD